jgi:hypothetical protein
MNKKTTRVFAILFLFAITIPLVAIPQIHTAQAAGTTTLAVKPPSIQNTALHVGDKFKVNVSVANVQDLYAWQIQLTFNASTINITSAFYPADQVFAGKVFMAVSPSIDNVNGRIIFGSTLLGNVTGFSGNGTLCQIQFEIKHNGSSGLNFSKPYGTRTWLKDSNLTLITATATDGYFSNLPPPPPPPANATVYIDPSRLVDPTLTPSNNFTINVRIANATNVYSFSFKLAFNQSIINATSAVLGGFFPGSVTPKVAINNTQGFLLFNASLSSPALPVSGNGTLATIKFQVEALGISDILLQNVQLRNQGGSLLPVVVFQGYFNNILLAKLAIAPAQIINPTLRVGDLVTVNVTIDDVENLYGYYFELTYNPSILTCIGVLITPVLNETHFTTRFSVDNGIGLVRVNVTYRPPAVPITTHTPMPIVKIYFLIASLGSSTLHFQNSRLTDPGGNPITLETLDGFIMSVIIDDAVTKVTLSRTWAYPSWPVNITITVKNLGNLTTSFQVQAYYNGTLIGTAPVNNLSPGNQTTRVITWNTTGVLGGNYTIKGEATLVPFESNTTNNVLTDGPVEILTQIHDVAIIAVSPSRTWAFAGWIVDVNITAKNDGDIKETFSIIGLYNTTVFGTFNVTNLSPGATITATFKLNTSSLLPCHTQTFTGEATPVPFEFDISNNILVDGTLKIRFFGDLNGDGFVDMSDIAIVSHAFGTSPGDPRWNPDADMNQDGFIDMTDIALVARNFGKGCP